MLRRHAVAAGFAAAGMGHLYYGGVLMTFSGVEAILAFVTGLALLQAAVGLGAGHGWTFGVGAGIAGLASLSDFKEILFVGYGLDAFANLFEGLGLGIVALAAAAWGLARWDGAEVPDRLDEEVSVVGLRVGAALAGLSSATYVVANGLGWSRWVPGNLLVVAGFGLVAYVARAPLFGEAEARDEPQDEPERPTSEAGSRPS